MATPTQSVQQSRIPENITLPFGIIPADLAQQPETLTDNAQIVMVKRYCRKDAEGNPAETINETFWRVASNIAEAEGKYGVDGHAWARTYFKMLSQLRFLPNSPTFTGAGTPLGNLSACFVLPIADDMGKEADGIFQTLRNAALIQQTGGGNGFAFTRLRSKGTRVKSSNGQASGPIGFLKAYDQAFGIVNQGGARRGANMGVLRVDHPDVREFITCKTSETAITNFNISVAITDDFMQAVIDDSDFNLVEPSNGEIRETLRARDLFDMIAKHAHHNGEPGMLFIDAANRSNPIPHIGTYEATNPCVTGDTWIQTSRGIAQARTLFESQEPVSVLVDPRFNHTKPYAQASSVFFTGVKPVYKLTTDQGYEVRTTAEHKIMTTRGWVEMQDISAGDDVHVCDPIKELVGTAKVVSVAYDGEEEVFDLTEPITHSFIANNIIVHNCGEQFLLPYESCNLGSVNLAVHVTADGRVDWDALQSSIEQATRFLDDVVEVNRYVDAVPQLREAALRARRIGLGFMGLADMMIQLDLRYGSAEGQEFAGQISEFMRYHAMRTSIELARERGAFPGITGSIYDPHNMTWEPPKPISPYTHDWGRPALDWDGVVTDIKQHGIRNAAQTTIAPTGTISTVSGCEGYGCEPVFALAYTRYVVDGDSRFELNYASPLLRQKLESLNLGDERIQQIIDQVSDEGTVQNVSELPDNVRNGLVVSSDITPEEHVRMQASIQAFIDNSISKTINMPATATVDDVQRAYQLAWELGCKGLTVYVTGSRDVVVLETKATRDAREKVATGEGTAETALTETHDPQGITEYSHKKPRPVVLEGKTYRMPTPVGTAYLTINENGHGYGQPFEVFINTSKAGSEIAAISEAIGRLISLLLRQTSPVSPRDRVDEIVRQLEDIGGGRQMGFGTNRIASLPDAIARVLAEYLQQTDAGNREEALSEAMQQLTGVTPELEAVNGHVAVDAVGDICPDCGSATLIRKEGCVSCHKCGYSEC